jgi:hypothetical protein
VLAELANAEAQLLLHLQEEFGQVCQFLEFQLDVLVQHAVLVGLVPAHRLPSVQLLPDLLELPSDGEDEPDGLLRLLLQLDDFEEVFVFELSEVLEGEAAVALAAVSPARANVLPTLLVVEDQVGALQYPALLPLQRLEAEAAVLGRPFLQLQGVDALVID